MDEEIVKNGSRLTRTVFTSDYDTIYEDPRWDVFVRDHVDNSVLMKSAIPMEVKNEDILAYEGDFYGFLKSKGFHEAFHWIQLRNNRMTHPCEFTEKVKMVFLIPDDKLKFLFSKFMESTQRHQEYEEK